MKLPAAGDRLVSAKGEVWVVLRCLQAQDEPACFAIDVIRQREQEQTQRSVNLTWDEFEEFCVREGIPYFAE